MGRRADGDVLRPRRPGRLAPLELELEDRRALARRPPVRRPTLRRRDRGLGSGGDPRRPVACGPHARGDTGRRPSTSRQRVLLSLPATTVLPAVEELGVVCARPSPSRARPTRSPSPTTPCGCRDGTAPRSRGSMLEPTRSPPWTWAPPAPMLAADEDGVWVGVDGGLLLRLDPDSGEVIATIETASQPAPSAARRRCRSPATERCGSTTSPTASCLASTRRPTR